MTLEVNLARGGFAQIWWDNIKYWQDEGLPTYEGAFEGLELLFPKVLKDLLDCKAIKRVK